MTAKNKATYTYKPMKWLERVLTRLDEPRPCATNERVAVKINRHGNVPYVRVVTLLRQAGCDVSVREDCRGKWLVVIGKVCD
jgi:hypothetical protein